MSHVWYLKRASKTSKQTVKSANNHYLELMAACKKNQAEQALKLILPWLNTLSQQQDNIEITTLSDAIAQVNNQLFTCAIEEIQQHLYGKKTSNDSWLGENLLKAIQQVNNSGIQCEHNTGFTLNPN